MNCDAARREMVLYVYQELSLDAEEILEQHLDECEGCRAELAKLQSMGAAVQMREMQVPGSLLDACRRERKARLALPLRKPSLWMRIKDAAAGLVPGGGGSRWLRPLGAMALVAVGFFGARLWDENRQRMEPAVVRVRNLNPDSRGGVQLVLEEVRQKTMAGRLDDDRIRQMLLSAAVDPADPGLRARTMDILRERGDSMEVRRALLQALQRDPNAGVRMKALDGLKPFAHDPETRAVLRSVLLMDENPGIKTQAIDLLLSPMRADTIGTLQELITRENNPYIRQRSVKALKDMNASVEPF